MAIVAIFTAKHITKQHYETLRKDIEWERRPPEGVVLHAASFDASGGIHVVDVWTSQALLDAFVNKRLMPALQKLNLAPPSVEVYPVHNLNAFAAIDQYKLTGAGAAARV